MVCTVLVTRNGYVKLLRNLASDVQAMCCIAEAMPEKLPDLDARLSEFHLKGQLMAEETKLVGDLQRRLDRNEVEPELAERTLESNQSAVKKMNQGNGFMEIVLGGVRPAIGQRQRAIHSFI